MTPPSTAATASRATFSITAPRLPGNRCPTGRTTPASRAAAPAEDRHRALIPSPQDWRWRGRPAGPMAAGPGSARQRAAGDPGPVSPGDPWPGPERGVPGRDGDCAPVPGDGAPAVPSPGAGGAVTP